MRKVTVIRSQLFKLPFTKGRILIDNKECETVKASKTAVFEIPDGEHDIQVIFNAIPPVNSNILRIEQEDGDTVFEVKIIVPLKSSPTYAELTKK